MKNTVYARKPLKYYPEFEVDTDGVLYHNGAPKQVRFDKKSGYVLQMPGATWPVHRLIFDTFYPEHPATTTDMWVIYHVNGDKRDNRLSNLTALPRGMFMQYYAQYNRQNR